RRLRRQCRLDQRAARVLKDPTSGGAGFAAWRTRSRILRALHNPPIRELRSAASVKESKAPPPPLFVPPPPLIVPSSLDTTRLTAEPLATFMAPGGLSLMTLPAATVLLDCRVTAPRVRPAPVMALVAADCVWPTTFGTETCVGPLETTRLTAEPLATFVPAVGLSLMTLPAATVLLDCIV